MKNIIVLIFSTVGLFSATLTLNEARDNNSSFSILHIKDDTPYSCKVELRDDFKDVIVCKFSRDITPKIERLNIDFKIESDKNIVKIIPITKYILRGLQDDFITSNVVETSTKKEYKHWIIIGYKDELDMFQSSNSDGINFDITYSENFYPYVDTLNIDGLPIIDKNDAVVMTRIKDRYKEQRYDQVVSLVDKFIVKDDTFLEEANLYKLRALDKLVWDEENSQIDKDDIIELSKSWIRDNPSSKYIPEVLMFISKTYYKLGHNKRADEYSDILKDEFYSNKFNHIAQIYKADRVYKNRKKRTEAINIYKDVLYNTEDLDIASKVSTKLSHVYMNKEDVDQAYLYYKKVIDANEAYLIKNKKESYKIAKEFAKLEKYEIAIKIVANLLGDKKSDKFKDDMIRDLGYWYDLSGDKNVAYGLYNQYLKDFKDGQHEEFVKSRLDKILVDMDETNVTKRLANLDEIILKYPDDSIYKKALVQKAKIYLSEGRYKDLFDMEHELKSNGGKEVLQDGAQNKITKDLKDDKCKSAIYLSQEYNVTVNTSEEKKFFECLMRFAKYKQALEISQKYISSKDLAEKLFWMHKSLHIHSRLGDNKKVIMLGDDIEKLATILRVDGYNDVFYKKAEAYYNLKDPISLMLNEVEKIEKFFPKDIRNIDLFSKVLKYAKSKKDDSMTAIYAKKIIDLQIEHKINDYSPNTELDYINALKRLKQYNKALQEDLKLLYVELTDKQKANVLYIAGDLSLKLDKTEEAKEFFTKCGEIVNDSQWQRLCAQSLKLFDE